MKLNNKFSIILVYISMVINSVLHFLITYIMTKKIINTEAFGKYSYILTIITYIAVYFNFGFNDGLTNIVANYLDERKIREFCGLGYYINILLSLSFSFFIFVYSLFDKNISLSFHIIIFSQSFIINDILSRLSIARKKTVLIVLNNFLTYFTVLILYLFINTNYINYISIYLFVFFIYTNLLFFIGLKPIFLNLKTNYNILLDKVKEYGFNVYIGRIASNGTYDLDKILLRVFAPIEHVGFYNLGLSCTNPITMFSESIMSILYKDMSSQNKINKKIIMTNTIWLLTTSFLFATFGRFIFPIIFGTKYKYVAECFTGFGIIAFLKGMYIPFSNFLSVKGYGKSMRNRAFIFTVANIIFNILLVPRYKMEGAISATIVALIVDNIAFYYYYKKVLGAIKTRRSKRIGNSLKSIS